MHLVSHDWIRPGHQLSHDSQIPSIIGTTSAQTKDCNWVILSLFSKCDSIPMLDESRTRTQVKVFKMFFNLQQTSELSEKPAGFCSYNFEKKCFERSPLSNSTQPIWKKWFDRPTIQIAQQLVRLITLVNLKKYLILVISPKPLKNFSRTTFWWSVLRKCTVLVF